MTEGATLHHLEKLTKELHCCADHDHLLAQDGKLVQNSLILKVLACSVLWSSYSWVGQSGLQAANPDYPPQCCGAQHQLHAGRACTPQCRARVSQHPEGHWHALPAVPWRREGGRHVLEWATWWILP
jgi:hypothetical protein